jgi:hypothetical protein
VGLDPELTRSLLQPAILGRALLGRALGGCDLGRDHGRDLGPPGGPLARGHLQEGGQLGLGPGRHPGHDPAHDFADVRARGGWYSLDYHLRVTSCVGRLDRRPSSFRDRFHGSSFVVVVAGQVKDCYRSGAGRLGRVDGVHVTPPDLSMFRLAVAVI